MQRHHITMHCEGRRAQPLFLVALVALAAGASVGASAQSAAVQAFRPVTDAMLKDPPAADWLSFRRTLNAWGYSPLDQIDGGNVKGLSEVWTAPVAGSEVTPLVHDGVMYLPLGGDGVVALDEATGKELWTFARELPN